jgi:ATP-binding cassette, subfamily B, bacterial
MKGFALNEKLRRDISVTGIEPWLTSEMDAANEDLKDIPTRPPWHARAGAKSSVVRQVINNVVESTEYLWLIYHGIGKGISLGTLDLIRSSAWDVLEHLWKLSYTADSATEQWKNLIAYYKILEIKSDIKLPENPVPYVSQAGGMKIEAKDIRYKYDIKSEEEVLKGTSFVINPGEMIAVVGYIAGQSRFLIFRFNGAGKSTLAKLLTRLANVTGGQLLVNDVDVQDYDPSELRRHLAVLFQDIGQYQGLTILENIGVGKVSELKSEGVVQQSAKDAGAAEFIEALPFKYDSFLGYHPGQKVYGFGVGRWDDSDSDSEDDDPEQKDKVQKNLSGGQWQKIALARSFMRGTEADLLVLDEPTANLDPEAEYQLFETIKRLRQGRTTVYISHRFNTVRAADRIMVMEKGEVKEFGTHEELMTLKDGKYHRLYTLQAKGFLLDDDGKVSKDVDGMTVDVKEDVIEQVIELTD